MRLKTHQKNNEKSDFIDLLSNNLNNYSEIDISISADLIQKAIIDSLKKRHRIEIRGFGTFCIRDRKSIRQEIQNLENQLSFLNDRFHTLELQNY